jgi:hypothetical protein
VSYDQLKTDGFLFTQTAVAFALMKADFGDGYGKGALISDPAGLRRWSVKIDVLPDSDEHVPKVDAQTRSEYLWNFFVASKRSGNYPFWLQDPKDEQFYLVEFVDDELSYDLLCVKVYSTGLQLRQRRVTDQATPVDSIPFGEVPDYGVGDYGG